MEISIRDSLRAGGTSAATCAAVVRTVASGSERQPLRRSCLPPRVRGGGQRAAERRRHDCGLRHVAQHRLRRGEVPRANAGPQLDEPSRARDAGGATTSPACVAAHPHRAAAIRCSGMPSVPAAPGRTAARPAAGHRVARVARPQAKARTAKNSIVPPPSQEIPARPARRVSAPRWCSRAATMSASINAPQ